MADAENWPVATNALLLAAQLVEAIQEGLATSKENTRARGTSPTRRDSRAAGHRPHRKISPSP